MNRLDEHLKNLSMRNEKALIVFITAGDPDVAQTEKILESLADNGADCIEIGMPFSDPIADGPVIQRSAARALTHNINSDDIFNIVQRFREKHTTPIVLMGYFNPIARYGLRRFVQRFRSVGGPPPHPGFRARYRFVCTGARRDRRSRLWREMLP